MTPLIDATEMYLRTVWELEEEGITPLRARLVERLHLSAPAVSETVARLEVEGLLHLGDGRRIELSERGREIATSVMRKHRLAELLLTDVIGLEWEAAHNEACRWEHVISDEVEQRLAELLGDPVSSPFGNPIPAADSTQTWDDLVTVAVAAVEGARGTVERISEQLQVDVESMRYLREHGIVPGVAANLEVVDGGVVMDVDGRRVPVGRDVAQHVFVSTAA